MNDAFFKDHMPIQIDGNTYILYSKGFVNCDKQVVKAILNGFPIDTSHKVELTDDLLEDEAHYTRERERGLVVLDI